MPHLWHYLRRSCKHACQQSFAWTLSDTLAPGHGGAGTAEDGDTVNAAEGTDDDAEEEDEEDDEADGTAVHAALNVSLLISAVYAHQLRKSIFPEPS